MTAPSDGRPLAEFGDLQPPVAGLVATTFTKDRIMNQHFSFKPALLAVFAAVSFAGFPAFAATATMSKPDYQAAKTRIGADFKTAKVTCDALSGNGKDVCVSEAKGKEKCPYDARPNKQEPGRLNTGITVVGKHAVIPRGVRIGRNVKIAADVRSSDFSGRIVRSSESVERRPDPRTLGAEASAVSPPAIADVRHTIGVTVAADKASAVGAATVSVARPKRAAPEG